MHQLTLIVLALTYYQALCVEFKQEQGKVIYFNPKYIKSLTVFTYRKDRHSPYLTSANSTNLVPFGNNITYHMELITSKFTAMTLKIDLTCDNITKIDWIKDFLKSHTNVPTNKCPTPAGNYFFRDMMFPPKNIPYQLADVDYTFKYYMFVTKTKERIAETTVSMKAHKGRG